MTAFQEIEQSSLYDIEGGCTWCKVGSTLITVGGVAASGFNPVAIAVAVPAIVLTWAY